MHRHAIAPTRRFTKVSHDVVRHQRLNSDAKLLVIYIQGLPEEEARKPLNRLAENIGITGRAFHNAKQQLLACGYLHQWRWQGGRGLWSTDQLMSNVTLTDEEAAALRAAGQTDAPPPPPSDPGAADDPSARPPAVGEPEAPEVGGHPPKGERTPEKTLPHPPPEAPAARAEPPASAAPGEAAEPGEPAVPDAPEVAAAERVLLSLRHTHRDLLLGVREARSLADAAAQWLRNGVSTADLRHALTSGLPAEGVRSAVGFVRHRLLHKLPAAAPPAPTAPPPRGLVLCEGPGPDHAFRPLGDETECGPCRQRTAAAAATPPHGRPRTTTASWRARLAEVTGDG